MDKAKALLGRQCHGAGHIGSMDWRDVPDFYRKLGNGVTELALRLVILTGARFAPIRFAANYQFDLDARIWTISAAHMKRRKGQTKDFRVPLCEEAMAVVREAMRHGGDLLFPGKRGKLINDMTMSKYTRERAKETQPHGFRASFRTCAEETGQPFEVAEMALGHMIGNAVERAYQRSDVREKRTPLMALWADNVTGKCAAAVVPLAEVRA